jgi:hypothetical protein
LLTITCWCLTEEWFILLLLDILVSITFEVWKRNGSYCCGSLYCWPLLFDVWQRSGSYCCGWLYSWPLMSEDWQRSGSYCCGW